ncbi:hypothetical protein ANN_27695 [Periplaneta americana]|uniref:ISXO2-like transposase domain-containing protein n=1 Tax=Periplaneta americana TaxID=6978 RepID=A0ABQ8RUX2_PERAM|nr:hypothetical protein ANN_27695 [Periplaneta americana]
MGDLKLSIDQILQFCAFWCLLPNPRHVTLSEEVEVSRHTVVDWSNFCREVRLDWVYEHRQAIGGPGTIVEIDESKFGRRKYNRGRLIEGQWVFGGVERGNPTNFFMEPVQNRDAETLVNLIQEWILPGTTIVSDCWKAYITLQNQGFLHLRVNHSVEFVDTADSGEIHIENLRRLAGEHITIHTQNIERKWSTVKYSIPAFGRRKQHFEGYFAEYIFKSNFSRSRLICEFFKRASLLYPPPQ